MVRLMQQAVHYPSKDKGHRGDRGKSAAGSTRCWARSGLAVMPSAKPDRDIVSIASSHHL